MILDLDAQTRDQLASMCYARWSKAYEAMKAIKNLKWEDQKQACPKSDWPLFHAEMIKNAEKELKLAEKLKDIVCPFSPLIKGEWYYIMSSKLKAWGNLHLQCGHILKYGWSIDADKLPLNNQQLREEFNKLQNSNLTTAQIDALGEVIYWAYQLGKEEATK